MAEDRLAKSGSPSSSGARLGDRGATFIELLVSIVLIGTAGVAVVTALAVAIQGADQHRDVADAQAWLASAGDALAEVPPLAADNYVPCDAAQSDQGRAAIVAAYQTVVDGLPIPHDVSVDDVQFWDSNFTADPTDDVFQADCWFTNGDRLQRITLSSDVAGATRDLNVVKRPALDQTVNLGTPPTTLGGGNYESEPTPGL